MRNGWPMSDARAVASPRPSCCRRSTTPGSIWRQRSQWARPALLSTSAPPTGAGWWWRSTWYGSTRARYDPAYHAPLSDDPIIRLPAVAAWYPAIPAGEHEPLALLLQPSGHCPHRLGRHRIFVIVEADQAGFPIPRPVRHGSRGTRRRISCRGVFAHPTSNPSHVRHTVVGLETDN
jgi:hypothetical protein